MKVESVVVAVEVEVSLIMAPEEIIRESEDILEYSASRFHSVRQLYNCSQSFSGWVSSIDHSDIDRDRQSFNQSVSR